MTDEKPKSEDFQNAKKAHSAYIAGILERLSDPDCPASIFAEARRFFEAEGISLEDGEGKKPAHEGAKNRLVEQLEERRKRNSG